MFHDMESRCFSISNVPAGTGLGTLDIENVWTSLGLKGLIFDKIWCTNILVYMSIKNPLTVGKPAPSWLVPNTTGTERHRDSVVNCTRAQHFFRRQWATESSFFVAEAETSPFLIKDWFIRNSDQNRLASYQSSLESVLFVSKRSLETEFIQAVIWCCALRKDLLETIEDWLEVSVVFADLSLPSMFRIMMTTTEAPSAKVYPFGRSPRQSYSNPYCMPIISQYSQA